MDNWETMLRGADAQDGGGNGDQGLGEEYRWRRTTRKRRREVAQLMNNVEGKQKGPKTAVSGGSVGEYG